MSTLQVAAINLTGNHALQGNTEYHKAVTANQSHHYRVLERPVSSFQRNSVISSSFLGKSLTFRHDLTISQCRAKLKLARINCQLSPAAFLALSGTTQWIVRIGAMVLFGAVLITQLYVHSKGEKLHDKENWFSRLFSRRRENKEEEDARRLTGNWHVSPKGTLVRKFRVPTLSEGKRLLLAIAGVLSDDDLFRDCETHKGCRIRRESAHGESVCCNNVRVLLDELPTAHLKLEVTVFPPGPITTKEYQRAGKLERVLRTGHSI